MGTDDFARAVGIFVKDFRKRHGITQFELRALAHGHLGMTWSVSSISNLETGRMTLTVPVLIALAYCLSELSGERLRLSDLLGDCELVRLSDEMTLRRSAVDRYLSGEVVEIEVRDRTETAAERVARLKTERRASVWYDELSGEGGAQGGGVALSMPEGWATEEHMKLLEPESTLAETRAARRLGIHPFVVRAWSHQLWGRSLDEESSRRAGDHATPQKRGHVTRALTGEIKAAIAAQDDRLGLF